MIGDKPCEGCKTAIAKSDNRFCSECSKKQIQKMRADGYLTPKVGRRSVRTFDMKENQYETKHGIDY